MRWMAGGIAWAVLLHGSGSVFAWNPQTRVRVVDEAVRLMPPSLRLALERHREDLLRGALLPMTGEDGPAHRPPWQSGTLEQEIARQIESLAQTVGKPASFRDLARRFGEVAHFVSDAGFPPVAAGPEGASRYSDFGRFCESRADRFPLVFYGHEDPDLARDDARGYALRILDRSRDEDRQLARAYAEAGTPPDPTAFDDRSVPFAVASLSYSRTVTDVVRAWLTGWGRGGGDLGKTPYLRSTRTYRR